MSVFQPYVAKNRVFKDMVFDFYIANEVGKSWYDVSPQQYMPERQWCAEHLKPGMTVVDCGAHHGMMSVIFSQAVGPSGRVIAYEALPSNANVIKENARLNGLRNIEVRPVGVGDKKARVPFDANYSNSVTSREKSYSHGLLANLFRRKPAEETIRTVILDDDLPRGLKIDFLKIDVEGFEVEAMKGMRRTIAQKPIIDLEIHNFLFKNRAADLSRLGAALAGYRFTVLGDIFGEMKYMGASFDIEYLMQFENPHVFCEPT